MLAKALVEALFSIGNTFLAKVDGWSVMVVHAGMYANDGVFVDAGALLMAAVVFCLAIVFEYGVLLQRLTDETI